MPQSPDFPDATADALVVVLDIAHGRESMALPGSYRRETTSDSTG